MRPLKISTTDRLVEPAHTGQAGHAGMAGNEGHLESHDTRTCTAACARGSIGTWTPFLEPKNLLISNICVEQIVLTPTAKAETPNSFTNCGPPC